MKTVVSIAVLLFVLSSTPLLADDPSVIFSDDFATLDPAWGEADAYKSVSGNRLIIAPNATRAYSAFYEGSLFGEADISVKVSLAKGSMTGVAGIDFWATDSKNYYCAVIGSDGMVGVMRKSKGTWLYPVNLKVHEAVNKGIGKVNELRVVTKGKTATFYVNGKQIASFKGFPPGEESLIGLDAESGDVISTWQFSDLVIRKPQ